MENKQSVLQYIFVLFWVVVGFTSCMPARSKCPAYSLGGPGKGLNLSMQDLANKSMEEIQAESVQLLDNQSGYIRVKRDKKTGLIVNNKRVGGRQFAKVHKKFQGDPDKRSGVDGQDYLSNKNKK
ncbi:MAG TPA: hypothetical protein DCM08_04810 [Microscillaceae bacterium]|nr:hypothetical protein [Microscillaceae bacterium]